MVMQERRTKSPNCCSLGPLDITLVVVAQQSKNMVTSYYDSVGLLAICDAIETIEGVQFKPSSAPAAAPVLESGRLNIHLPAPYPEISSSSGNISQHHFLNHVPPHATVSASGSIPYSQAQQAALSQFKVQSGSTMPFQKSVPPAPRPGQVTTPSHAGPPPVQNSYNYPIQPLTNTTTAVPVRPTVAANVPTSNMTQHSTQKDGSKSEECHVCGRIFKGPKASTHKQQHIRRLHPNDYTPKRGGKRRAA